MRNRTRLGVLMLMAGALGGVLGGCATSSTPTQVTRFHRLGAAPAATLTTPCSVRVVADGAALGATPGEVAALAAAVEARMQRLGLTPVAVSAAPGSECYRVVMTIERGPIANARGGSGVGVGVGGSTGSYGSGVGVGVGVGIDITRLLGGGGADTLLRLGVRINDGAGQSVWEGRAETGVRRRAHLAQPELVAARLADALFSGFPGRSGETISIP